MRIGNLSGRLTLFTDAGAIDVADASDDRFGPDPLDAYRHWTEFRAWASEGSPGPATPFEPAELGPPVPAPGQIFGIGLNYRDHAAEANLAVPEGFPPVFTKFRGALSGPYTTVTLPVGGNTDWEVELVVVIGPTADRVSKADAWQHVAGLTVGQDLSERIGQMAGPAPQFSLGKSHRGFAPVGPWVVTVDELANRDDLELGCAIDGEPVQKGRTSDLIFDVAALVAGLSAVTPLSPGDLIFTGTPAGVGMGRKPPRFLKAGEELVTYISGIGELRQKFVG